MDLTDPDLIRTVREAGQHLLPLNDYLRRLPVIPDGKHDPIQFAQIRATVRFLADRPLWCCPDRFSLLEVPGLTGPRVVAASRPFRDLVVLEREAPVACIRNGLPFARPAHRGRELGALLVLISDLTAGRFLCPVTSSDVSTRIDVIHLGVLVCVRVSAGSGPFPRDREGRAPGTGRGPARDPRRCSGL